MNGEPRLIVEVAPIRGTPLGDPRYDSTMTDDQRRDLRNLLLLCDPHRNELDAKELIDPVEVLHRWKGQRESNHGSALKHLREATPPGLRKIVPQGLQEHDKSLIRAQVDTLHTEGQSQTPARHQGHRNSPR